MATFGQKVKKKAEIRQRLIVIAGAFAGCSITELGRMAGFKQGSLINNWLSLMSTDLPNAFNLEQMASELGITMDYIWRGAKTGLAPEALKAINAAERSIAAIEAKISRRGRPRKQPGT